MKELRHDKYQIAMPGKNSASLVWRNANNMEKRTPIRAGKRPVNPALCRGTHQGALADRSRGQARLQGRSQNRSVVMNRYQVLTHNHAGGKVGAQLLGQSGDGLGGSVEGMKQAEIGAALAGVAATQKFDANQFWAGVLKRAERHSKAIQRNQSRSLKDGLGVALQPRPVVEPAAKSLQRCASEQADPQRHGARSAPQARRQVWSVRRALFSSWRAASQPMVLVQKHAPGSCDGGSTIRRCGPWRVTSHECSRS